MTRFVIVQVLFWDADASDVFTARVLRNDPFLKQIWVEVLRSRATLPAAAAPSEPDEGGEVDGEVDLAPPQAKRVRTPKVPEPELYMATLVHCEEDETVPLTYVPCVNGIVKTGSVAAFDGGRGFRVDKLWYDGRRKKAFAQLTAISDEVLYYDTLSCIAETTYVYSAEILKRIHMSPYIFAWIDQLVRVSSCVCCRTRRSDCRR